MATVNCGKYSRSATPLPGESSSVYHCTHADLPLDLVAKVIAAAGREERLLSHARTLAEVSHPNVMRLHDYCVIGASDDSNAELWLITERCTGGSLAALPAIPQPAEFEAIVQQVLQALAWLHRKPLLHLNLKPENICLALPLTGQPRDVSVRLVDFGLPDGARTRLSPRHDNASDDVWAAGLSLLWTGVGLSASSSTAVELATEDYSERLEKLLQQCETTHGARVTRVLRGMLLLSAVERLSAAGALDLLATSDAATVPPELSRMLLALEQRLAAAEAQSTAAAGRAAAAERKVDDLHALLTVTERKAADREKKFRAEIEAHVAFHLKAPKVDKIAAEDAKGLGNKATADGNFDEAVTHYTRAIEFDPSNHLYYSNRSAAYMSLHQPEKALADGEQCVRLNPTWGKGYSRQGAALHALGRFEEAVAAYEAGLRAEPSNKVLRDGLDASLTAQTAARSRGTTRAAGDANPPECRQQ